MVKASKNVILGSMAVSAIVAVCAVTDLVVGIPFGGFPVFDIVFLIASGLVLYMGWDAYKDVK